MRVTIVIFVALCLVALTFASPAGKKQAPACARDCGEKYSPLCGKEKNGSKLLTFGNECVLLRFNCEHPDGQYNIDSVGECAGNVSVRLS
ncbi:uncharacterized protein LOC126764424 [Bactrocera neohumeralis]|uniref:Uncharacterized protein LOC105226079 n=1 Tax=Bactrocera dorsalis TaxID=27457 RepID=A0A6I9V316_BACDO|nr:uncharacterized protein LOC105226079 [Bactrocera dorsalis]XP_039969528.1 uncharacterized protein LOC120781385 [Bactrocera tryoni]XP_050338068.1 uncharacterized protein LOC126764424 [Bactrocera neohumeralis]